MAGTVLHVRSTAVYEKEKKSHFHGLYILVGETENKQITNFREK